MKRFLFFGFVVATFLAAASGVMAQYEVPKADGDAKAFVWPEGKRCAVCLSFDDARLSQVDVGTDLLNAHGVKATFYVSPHSLLKRLDKWKAAAKDGHEIGNHTMSHPCTGNYAFSRDNALEDYDLDRMEKEMDDENQLIFEKFGIRAKSFAYPCGQRFVGRGVNVKSYVPLVAKKFTSGRCWLSERANDPQFCDPAQLLGVESDGKTFEELKALVDEAAEQGRWLILAGHEIGDGGRQTTLIPSLEKLCDYANDPANGIWIDTVGAVCEYVMKARGE